MAQRQFRLDDTSVWPDKYGNGSDGAYTPSTSTDAPIDSACTGTINTTSLSATNASFSAGQLILIHQTQGTGAGQWEFNKIASYSTGTITTSYPLIYGYSTGAQVLVLKQYTSALIDTGVTLTVKQWNGTVGGIMGWFCLGTTTITGTLQLSGRGFKGGVGGNNSGAFNGYAGENYQRASTATGNSSADYSGGGQGRASDTSAGGGGHATGGSSNDGLSCGNAGLTTMLFGGGGGGISRDSVAGNGGLSGTIAIIVSKTITVTGSIANNGTGPTSVGSSPSVSGGGGSGGSVLLKGQNITLGSGLVVASGGVPQSADRTGRTGSAGRIHADYSSTITGTTTPTIDTRQDSILADIGGSFIFNLI